MASRRQQLFMERGPGSRIALYINGDLQFDSTDERRYHEFLVLPALAAARQWKHKPLRVLILGGGDGLALREVLRHDVRLVDLVDCDADVIAFARSDLRELNAAAFEDARVRVHIQDAREFVRRAVERGGRYDVIVSDLTVPIEQSDCGLYSLEWFGTLRRLLGRHGVLATNAASPFVWTHAFWSIHNALLCAGFDVRPLHFSLPSFASHGYGEWGFCVAGPAALGDLGRLQLVHGVEVDADALRAALRFPRSIVALQPEAMPERDDKPALLYYLLNPDESLPPVDLEEPVVDFSGRMVASPELAPAEGQDLSALGRALSACLPLREDTPIDIDRVVDRLPLQHRYQTRAMLRELAADWVAYVRSLDLVALVEMVLARARELPTRILDELRDLRDRLRAGALDPERLLTWGGRVATVLIIVLILANTLMPDSAFAKGPAGGGAHFSAPHAVTHTTPAALTHNLVSDPRSPGSNRVTDFFGNDYPRSYYYYHPFSHGVPVGGPRPSPSPSPNATAQPGSAPAPAQLAASAYHVSADTIVLDNGGTIVTLGNQHYLVVAGDALILMRDGSADMLYALYRSPALVNELTATLSAQLEGLRDYRDSLQTRVSGIRLFERTADRLAALEGQLQRALLQLGSAGTDAAAPAGSREIIASAYALRSGVVAVQGADGAFSYLRSDRLYDTEQAALSATGAVGQAPADLRSALASTLRGSVDEDTASLSALDADIGQLSQERANAIRDLAFYQTDERDEGPNDPVDYGTSSVAVHDAVALAQSDLASIQRDLDALLSERAPLAVERQDLLNALRSVQ